MTFNLYGVIIPFTRYLTSVSQGPKSTVLARGDPVITIITVSALTIYCGDSEGMNDGDALKEACVVPGELEGAASKSNWGR